MKNYIIWKNRLAEERKKYLQLKMDLDLCQADILMSQSNLAKEYKDMIVQSFLSKWEGTPIHLIDEILYHVILKLADQKNDYDITLETKFDEKDDKVHIKYKDLDSGRWVEITP